MFQGFSHETFEFFMAIRFNNNSDFFHANYNWYLRSVRQPCLALAEALADTVEWLDDSLERRPNRVVSRINRDIRFSNDKSPYRDYLWLAFRRPGEERKTTMGVFADLSDSGVNYGMGYYSENRPMMNALRRRILTEPDALNRLLQPMLDEFPLYINGYRRLPIPDGVPEELLPLYKAKSFYLEKSLKDFDLIQSPSLADEIREGYRRLAPLYRYLTALTPVEDNAVFSK